MAKAKFNLSMNKDLKKEILSNAVDEELNGNEYILMTHRMYCYFKREFEQNGDIEFFNRLVHNLKAEVKTDLK